MRASLISIALVASVSLGGCAKREWRVFTSDAGGFKVLMPGTPKPQTQSVNTAAGTIDVTMYIVEVDHGAYAVGFSDFPQEMVAQADPQAVLEGAMNGSASNMGGSVTSSRDITLGAISGKEFTAAVRINEADDAAYKGRVYLAGNRLYQVFMCGLKGRTSAKEIDHFLRSFTLR